MNDEVFLVSDRDEVYLGTVRDITEGHHLLESGRGISLKAAFSDIVSALAFGSVPKSKQAFIIELRKPSGV